MSISLLTPSQEISTTTKSNTQQLIFAKSNPQVIYQQAEDDNYFWVTNTEVATEEYEDDFSDIDFLMF